MTPDDVVAAADERAEAAAAAMASATEGASLCSVSRTGEQIPGVKYPEGRWSAMRALRRSLRSGMDPAPALAELRAEWGDDLAARQSRGEENWRVYRLGGLDALTEVAELLGDG